MAVVRASGVAVVGGRWAAAGAARAKSAPIFEAAHGEGACQLRLRGPIRVRGVYREQLDAQRLHDDLRQHGARGALLLVLGHKHELERDGGEKGVAGLLARPLFNEHTIDKLLAVVVKAVHRQAAVRLACAGAACARLGWVGWVGRRPAVSKESGAGKV